MKEKWEILKETLTENTTITRRELLLALLVCTLGGIVFGFLTAPKRFLMIGSNNGNNTGSHNVGQGEEEMPEDEIADWEEEV